ncbi:MAG: urea active transporter [Chaenotheca gracillima]|nr:MAG: urea active transporter [Chaenotheca gracillima]
MRFTSWMVRLVVGLSFCVTVSCLGQTPIISFNETDGSLQLAGGDGPPDIVVAGEDWAGVIRAAKDLALDFGRVSGANGTATIVNTTSSNGTLSVSATGGSMILAGTMGKSFIIDNMISSGKINASEIDGKWESFQTQVVDQPLPGVSRALVIVGSDKRGTIYGLYDVSEQIGVSPWYWWADVVAVKHSDIHALNMTKTQGPPSVKYRGIFINDEAPALTNWINANYPPSPYGPGFNSAFYSTIFELLLRMRANYFWPAQWNSMFNADDPQSQPLADEYGIVMGTSHTEPMVRATKEWNVFGKGEWNWNTNNASIIPFFREGAQRAKPYESVFTVGMRGSGDTALSPTIDLPQLENITATQRDILTDVFDTTDLSTIPQMWCLYKEVEGYYEEGLRVPEDVTLLWTDDNFGNVRRLPLSNETSRSGGAGIYFHVDYVGEPRNYKWINTISLQKNWEQLHLTYEYQAQQIWILNVGDLKPVEIPINHFLDLAYDMPSWGPESTMDWLQMWATREFGESMANDIATVLNTYSVLAGRRKYELVEPETYSLINYNEADTVLEEWKNLTDQAQSIYEKLDAGTQPSFFELVLHPTTAAYTVHDIHISAARNNLYAMQGRSSTNQIAQSVMSSFQQDHNLTDTYHKLLDGKWNHMMDQTHLGYVYWQQPMRQSVPGLQWVQSMEIDLAGALGVSIEGSNASVPGDDSFHTLSSNTLTFPPMDPYGPSTRWMDIYARSSEEFNYNISTNATWVTVKPSSGALSGIGNNSDIRAEVSVDWTNAPLGSSMVTINISSSTDYGSQFSMPQVILPVNHTELPTNFSNGFVESDGVISIEAEHTSSNTSTEDIYYTTIPSYGRTLSGVTLFPVTSDSQDPSSSPYLQYDFFTFTNMSELANVTLYLGTSLNFNPTRPLMYAIAIDGAMPKNVSFVGASDPGGLPTGWDQAVSDNVWLSTTQQEIMQSGNHTMKLWAVEPGVVFQKIVMSFGGIRDSYLGPPESYRATS